MSIKQILVPLPASTNHAGEIDMALSVAKVLGAHVEALFINRPPPARGGDVPFTRGSMVAAASLDLWAEEQEQAARAAQAVPEACAAHAIPLLATNEAPRTLPAASWHEVEGSYLSVAVQRAAAFDLSSPPAAW